jgi:hypothetical protein
MIANARAALERRKASRCTDLHTRGNVRTAPRAAERSPRTFFSNAMACRLSRPEGHSPTLVLRRARA